MKIKHNIQIWIFELLRDCEIFANLCLKLYPLYVEQQSVVDSSRASDHLLPLLSLPIITQHHPANNAWDLSDISIFTSGSLIQNDEFAKYITGKTKS